MAGDKTLGFAFVNVTNLPSPITHMHNLTFAFHDKGHITQEWTIYKDGKEMQKVVINLERVK